MTGDALARAEPRAMELQGRLLAMVAGTLARSEQMAEEAAGLHARAMGAAICGQESYDAAVALAQEAKRAQRAVDELLAEYVAAGAAIHKFFVAKRDAPKALLAEAEAVLKARIVEFDAAKRMEEERTRREAQARAEREAEAQRKAVAAAAKKSGAGRVARAVVTVPDAPPAPPPALQRSSAVTIRLRYYGEVVDQVAFLKAVGDGAAPRNLVAVDQSALNKYAEATEGQAAVPGVRFWSEKGATIRSGF